MVNSRTDKSLIVVYQPIQLDQVAQVAVGHCAVVLDFLQYDSEISQLDSTLGASIGPCRRISASTLMNEAQESARPKYIKFWGECPSLRANGGQSIIESLRWDNNLSLWWISSASLKENETDPLFSLVTHLECVKAVVSSEKPTQVVVVGGNREQHFLFRSYCESQNISFQSFGESVGMVPWRRRFPLGLKLLIAVCFYSLMSLLSRIAVIRRPTFRRTPTIAFFSLFPTSLKRDSHGQWIDRNYPDLPSFLEKETGMHCVYLVWFNMAAKNVLRPLRLIGKRTIPMIRYLRIRDLSFVFKYFKIVSRVRRMLKTRDYCDSILYDDCALGPLIVKRLDEALKSISLFTNLVAYECARQIPSELSCRAFFQFLDFYPLGRATYAGFATSKSRPTMMGLQHAAISEYKLWFCHTPEETRQMPLPDYFLCQGESYAKVLRENGIAEHRIKMIGSPRYEKLFGLLSTEDLMWKDRTNDREEVRILVASSLSMADAKNLIDSSVLVAKRIGRARLVIRPHPDTDVVHLVRSITRRHSFFAWEMGGSQDLYDSILSSALVIYSYSTVGDEAVALGVPTVSYAGMEPTMSSSFTVGATPIARTESELYQAAISMLSDEKFRRAYQQRRADLLNYSFKQMRHESRQEIVKLVLN